VGLLNRALLVARDGTEHSVEHERETPSKPRAGAMPRERRKTDVAGPARVIIPLLNYLTSELDEPTMPKSRKKGEPDACGILACLWQLIQSVMDDSEPDLEALGLSPKAFFLLAAVEEHPFPAVLARRMHLPPPTVTYMVKQLEKKGLLERRAEPGDLRKFRLVQTAAGTEALRRGTEALGLVLDDRLRRLDPEEVVIFDRIVKRLAGRNGGGDRR
jgi:DNA-binding MarR family transcriptional regulator